MALKATGMLLNADVRVSRLKVFMLMNQALSARIEWWEIHRMVHDSIIRRGGLAVMIFGRNRSVSETPSSLRRYLVEGVAFLELMCIFLPRSLDLG
jgi:hypothetical protein